MTDLFRWAGYGDGTTPFDHEATAFNPLFVYGIDDGEPCLVYTPTTSQTFIGKSPLGSPASISGQFVIKLSAYPTASVPIVAPLQSSANGGGSAWRLRLTPTGTLIIDNPSNTATGTTPAIPLNTRVLVKYIANATTVKVRLYNAPRGGSLIGTETTGTSTFGLVDNYRQGQASSTVVIPQHRLSHILVTDGTTWLPDPEVPATLTTPRYGIIGDSLTAMSGANGEYLRQSLLAAGTPPRNVYLWGVGGKRIAVADLTGKTSAQNIQDAKNVLTTIDHWIVALGTNDRPQNDATVNAAIDTILTSIGGTAKVTWIGLTSKGSASTDDIRVNNLVKAKLAARGNAVFADWDAHIRAVDGGDVNSPLWISADTTHLSALGYMTERAPFFVAQFAENTPVKVTAAGSLALTGSATRTVRLSRTASGTFALNGTAQSTVNVGRVASGTLTLTGTAQRVVRVTRTATAALALTGAASTSGATERTADGTLTLAGTATTAVRIARTAQGTLALGGIGSVTFHVVRTALGILTLTGQGVVAGEVAPVPRVRTLTEVDHRRTLTPIPVSHTLEEA